MPSTGFYLFLRIVPLAFEAGDDSVNALNGLLLISSIKHKGGVVMSRCVNALNGLLLISSVTERL